MAHEFEQHLQPELRNQVNKLLKTNSKIRGEKYWKGPKRILDYAISGLSSPASLAVILLAGTAIIIDGGWPPIHLGKRPHPGKENGEISLLKLRTMEKDAEIKRKFLLTQAIATDTSPLELKRNDPRITRLGRFFRKTSLDESPQFLNVLWKYSLWVVGTRPFDYPEWDAYIRPNQAKSPYKEYIEYLKGGMNYGMTGPDVLTRRGNLDPLSRVCIANIYAEKSSLEGDLRMIRLTPRAVFSRRGAY